MKGNVIQMNTLHLNSVRLNGIGKVQSVSLKGGSTEDPVFPPVEPPVEPTPTYTLSASVTNGKVSAKRNGSAVNLPFTANEGDTIVLEVTPNDGYTFEGWADGNTDNPRSITMTADVALSAQCVEVVQPPVGKYIQFEDPAVEAICVANWSSDGIGLTEDDAAAVTSIGTTFKGNTEITSFNEFRYFTKVTSIPTNAFDACSNLRSIGVNWGEITSIGANAFRNCSSLQLEEVAAPKLTNLGSAAFHAIPALKRVTDLGFVPSVQLKTFYNTGLLFINFPATITSIGSQVFRYVTTLEQVIVRATTPPSLDSLAFQNTNDTFIIYVPDASLEAYKTAVNWSAYADRIHPLSEIEGDNGVIKYDGLVGAYTFKGRSNEDADYDLVQDRSGNGNIMTIYWTDFGKKDSNLPDLLGNGYWNDMLWFNGSTYAKIALPNGLTTMTVISKRTVFNPGVGGIWTPLIGSGSAAGKGLLWMEYREGSAKEISQFNGKKFVIGKAESPIVWMNNTYYNGHLLTGTEGADIHDGIIYLNRFRGDVAGSNPLQMTCLYIFNRELAPAEIETFIKAHIDADYVLPTIEQ